ARSIKQHNFVIGAFTIQKQLEFEARILRLRSLAILELTYPDDSTFRSHVLNEKHHRVRPYCLSRLDTSRRSLMTSVCVASTVSALRWISILSDSSPDMRRDSFARSRTTDSWPPPYFIAGSTTSENFSDTAAH